MRLEQLQIPDDRKMPSNFWGKILCNLTEFCNISKLSSKRKPFKYFLGNVDVCPAMGQHGDSPGGERRAIPELWRWGGVTDGRREEEVTQGSNKTWKWYIWAHRKCYWWEHDRLKHLKKKMKGRYMRKTGRGHLNISKSGVRQVTWLNDDWYLAEI